MFVFSVHKTEAWTAWDQNWENGELATLWYDYDKFVSNDAHLKFLQCITKRRNENLCKTSFERFFGFHFLRLV